MNGVVKERPILFNGAMVRAILSGAKTQTRRVMKPQPEPTSSDYPMPGHRWPSKAHQTMLHVETEMQKLTGLAGHACPFGQPGDRLWVRETWMPGYYHEADHEDGPQVSIIHRANNAEVTVAAPSYELAEQWEREFSEDGDEAPPWRPSIHMPRWACRLVLEITSVRVERLQALPEADWEAEGISFCMEHPSTAAGHAFNEAEHYAIAGVSMRGTPEDHGMRAQFAEQGLDWDSNPWVWVIEFKRIEA